MLDDANAAGRGQKTGARRQVQTAGAVAAGADGIYGRRALRYVRLDGKLAHRCGESADLFGGFALRTQAGKKRAAQCRGHVAGRHGMHQR